MVLPDALELAQTVAALRGAESASVETAVATVHPDWSQDQVKAEVAQIYEEMNIDVLARARVTIGAEKGQDIGSELESVQQEILAEEQGGGSHTDPGDSQDEET